MNYQTRHLEALTDIPHGRELVPTGKRFHASSLDAGYYLDRKMAKEVPAEPEKPVKLAAPMASPTAPDVRRPGRPTNAERAARTEPPKPADLLQTTTNTPALADAAVKDEAAKIPPTDASA